MHRNMFIELAGTHNTLTDAHNTLSRGPDQLTNCAVSRYASAITNIGHHSQNQMLHNSASHNISANGVIGVHAPLQPPVIMMRRLCTAIQISILTHTLAATSPKYESKRCPSIHTHPRPSLTLISCTFSGAHSAPTAMTTIQHTISAAVKRVNHTASHDHPSPPPAPPTTSACCFPGHVTCLLW